MNFALGMVSVVSGGILIYAGIKNAKIDDVLKSIYKKTSLKPITPGTGTPHVSHNTNPITKPGAAGPGKGVTY
jgi:hypothetical protein